ncbi:MAG: hypothetical protein PHP49_02830 [Bacilli bacterium]|nr:hypothetical protein [Bacilli bacterium]
MNNIQIKLSSGEIIPAELISSFELINIGKKYLFYTKNEVVENNLIKMYVAEIMEANSPVSVGEKISEQEWINLKNVMKSILTSNNNTNIRYIDIEVYKLENVINIKEPNVLAIDDPKKVKFKEEYESVIKKDIIQNPVIKEEPIQSIESNISTPAELLAKELIEPKIQEEAKAAPADTSIKQENINIESVQDQPQQENNLDNIGNDYVLGIINKITKLQGDLDSIGEDVIRLSNIYQISKEDKVGNEIPQVEKPLENKEEPVIDVQKEPLITENIEEISPFSVKPGSPNIFDEQEQNKGLAA